MTTRTRIFTRRLFAAVWLALTVVFALAESSVLGRDNDPTATLESVDGSDYRASSRGGWRGRPVLDAPFEIDPYGKPERVELPRGDQDIEAAILLLQDREYAEAIPLLERALQRTPTVEAIWEALGWSYFGVGRAADAEALWRQYFTLRPESSKANSLLAQLAIIREDWREADRYLVGALAADPSSYDLRYWYAQNLLRLGRLEQSVDLFEKLVAEDDQRFDVKADFARLCVLNQRHEDAVDLWSSIGEAFPEHTEFQLERARALLLVGALDEADAQAMAVLQREPQRLDAIMIRADIAELYPRPEHGVEVLRALIEEAASIDQRAHLHARLGARYLILHREDPKRWPLVPALEQYKAAVETVPDHVAWLNQYAGVAVMANQPRVARRVSERVLETFNPYNLQALRLRFEIAMLARDYQAAERALDDVYAHFQQNSPYRHFDRARIAVQRGRYNEAMDELDKLEALGRGGAVLGLLYHGLAESEWQALTSTRRLREHLTALKQAGFKFIAPSDVPVYLAAERAGTLVTERLPWPARAVDAWRYAFTGRRRHERREDVPIEKVAVVTFDDGLRSSFQLGTPIAQELDIPFGMFVFAHIEEINALMYAAWEEIRAYRETGVWEIGSHLMHSHAEVPAGPDSAATVYALPNRLWLPERNRNETLREWTSRLRHEFAKSRELIEKQLAIPPDKPMSIAYPYGEVGQVGGSNVARYLNPISSILNEASRMYAAGYVVDPAGYTCSGESLLALRRYEPSWRDDGETVVAHALMQHPVLLARRMRAEIAALNGRPALAQRQIDLLRREGYPESELREVADFVRSQSVIDPTTVIPDVAARERRARVRPSNLYVAGEFRDNQANEQILLRHEELRAGLNINPYIGIEAAGRSGLIRQTLTSNIWFVVQEPRRSVSTERTTVTTAEGTSVTEVRVESTVVREVQTNRVETYGYTAEVDEVRGALVIRLPGVAVLRLVAGEKTIVFEEGPRRSAQDRKRKQFGSLAATWSPYPALRVTTAYEHDLVPSALQPVAYDAASLALLWQAADVWNIEGAARYASYRDRNAMVSVSGASFLQVLERQGFWLGVETAVHTMDAESEIYWSPYWDMRVAGVMRLRRIYPLYAFTFDARIGQQREKARSEAMNEFRNLRAQAESDGTWDAGAGPEADWASFVGLSGSYRQRVLRHVDLVASLNVNFLREYAEHDLTLGLQLTF